MFDLVDHLLEHPDLLWRCARLEFVGNIFAVEKAQNCFTLGCDVSKMSQQCTHFIVLGVSHAFGVDKSPSGFFKKRNPVLQLNVHFLVSGFECCAKALMISDEVGELLIGTIAANWCWVELIFDVSQTVQKFDVDVRCNPRKCINQSSNHGRRRILTLRKDTESVGKSSGGAEIIGS